MIVISFMQEIAIRGKLVAKNIDSSNYITYVFENLESDKYENKYIMCVQFPNWNQSMINIGDIGFVNVRYVQEGVSTWFNGSEFVPYKYTNVIFLKFIPESQNNNSEFIVD